LNAARSLMTVFSFAAFLASFFSDFTSCASTSASLSVCCERQYGTKAGW